MAGDRLEWERVRYGTQSISSIHRHLWESGGGSGGSGGNTVVVIKGPPCVRSDN